MPSCRDIDPLITPYVDQEASAEERSAVADHLDGCAPCQRRAVEAAAGRTILRATAEHLHVEPSAALRARCERARVSDRGVGAPTRSVRAWMRPGAIPVRRWALAACAVVASVGLVMFLAGSVRVMAAELTLDHLKCFALFEQSSGPGDARAIGARLQAEYGWRLRVPDTSPALGLSLTGGRRCFSTDGRIAHILYRHHGRPLSLFAMPSTVRAADHVAVLGHQAIIWSADGITYALVAREPFEDLAKVAAYMKGAVSATD